MSIPDLSGELASVDLGDWRLNQRAISVVRRLQSAPDAGLPTLFRDPSDLEAVYRLLNNDRVDHRALLAPHARESWKRASASASTLVLHDTTEFAFQGEADREGLAWEGQRQCFHGHFALAVPEAPGPAVHGVVAMRAYVLQDGAWCEDFADGTGEELLVGSQRWVQVVQDAHAAAPATVDLIHVMDREADDYVLMSRILELGGNFVIRSCHDRRLVGAESVTVATSAAPVLVERDVHLGRRSGHKRPPRSRRTHPVRDARTARLGIRATQVELKRPKGAEPLGNPTLLLNVVEVIEIDPPSGVQPVHWRLFTTLPINTPEDIARVVDIYRKRWLIEEYFRSLKTGCAYEARQAKSLQALLRILVLSIPVAWRLLVLRETARTQPDAPGSTVLDQLELHVLRRKVPRTMLPPRQTAHHVLLAIARLGGHLPSNGQPGWLVLARGWQTLMAEVDGWRAALRWAGKEFA